MYVYRSTFMKNSEVLKLSNLAQLSTDAAKRFIVPGPMLASISQSSSEHFIDPNVDLDINLNKVIFQIRLDKNGRIVKNKNNHLKTQFLRDTCMLLDKEMNISTDEVYFYSP